MLQPNAGAMPPLSTPGTNQTGIGGQALPPYLQTRKPLPKPVNGAATAPVMTPSSTGSPGEVANPTTSGQQSTQPPLTPKAITTPPVGSSPMAPAPTPPQAGGSDLAGTYNFFKSDLQNQAKQAKANAVTDASARGVYYGTPLTGSEADIDTQLQRGLGQLGAGLYGNQMQDTLTRLSLATNLVGSTPSMPTGSVDPGVMSAIGALFGGNNAVSGARKSPLSPAAKKQDDAI